MALDMLTKHFCSYVFLDKCNRDLMLILVMDLVLESEISVPNLIDFLSTSNQTSSGSLTVNCDLG